MTDLTFLPWLRRGMVGHLPDVDTGQTSFPRSAPVTVSVEIDEQVADGSVQLRPADHVTGIDLGQIARRYPGPDANEVETGYWPAIEFSTADLPWAVTPLVADPATGRLRPWLVLICVPEDAAHFSAAFFAEPAAIAVDAALLPDLADSALWAHVQSAVPAADVAANASSTSVMSRLVAPVTLAASTTYRVALVPAFTPVDADLEPAWAESSGQVTLRVFDTWKFTTGIASTFEELVGLLGPVPASLGLDLGVRAVDITDLGAADPWPDDGVQRSVDYLGALADTDVTAGGLAIPDREAFQNTVIGLLDQAKYRAEPASGGDPVVAPPFYGSDAKGVYELGTTATGWLRFLNLMPRHRMAAGLGAEIVRINQERYMARAWEQAGEIQEMRRSLNASRLQAEIGRTWKRRTDRLDDGDQVAVLRPQYTTVRADDGRAPRAALTWSGVPNGLLDPAFTRAVRPGSVAARSVARRSPKGEGDQQPKPVRTTRATLADALGDPETRTRIGFGRVDAPPGAKMAGSRAVSTMDVIEGVADPYTGTAATRFTDERPDDVRLADVAQSGRRKIRPMHDTRARTVDRIGGLADHLAEVEFPDDEVPVRVKIGPTIDEALVWALIERSVELFMPGASDLPNNSVRLVEANPSFIAAFLAGANHEMGRELLWREYPADMGTTTFHRFWDRRAGDADIDDMSEWPRGATLTSIGTSGDESVVLLARGDVFRLYPTMQILLRDPKGTLQPPSFGGIIPPSTRFFAFDVESADEVYSGGWKIRFQEQPTEPRFGLDDDVKVDETNAATFAATTHQRPFAQEFDVVDIIGEQT